MSESCNAFKCLVKSTDISARTARASISQSFAESEVNIVEVNIIHALDIVSRIIRHYSLSPRIIV